MFRIVHKDPFLPFYSLLDEFRPSGETEKVCAMALDVTENDEQYQLLANLPGIKKENVNISMEQNQLIIEAKHEEKDDSQNHNFLRSERFCGAYHRSITFPENADIDNIKAKLENGVLNLIIPKKEPKSKREIFIE